jgi:hypothetical protein
MLNKNGNPTQRYEGGIYWLINGNYWPIHKAYQPGYLPQGVPRPPPGGPGFGPRRRRNPKGGNPGGGNPPNPPGPPGGGNNPGRRRGRPPKVKAPAIPPRPIVQPVVQQLQPYIPIQPIKQHAIKRINQRRTRRQTKALQNQNQNPQNLLQQLKTI